ncbi:MAG: sugar ABC transporter substrate-binding protein [Chloroflexi bacterium]|nr:sugar ABC transporter substrate-binding protein [Chloroflexota bacterium]
MDTLATFTGVSDERRRLTRRSTLRLGLPAAGAASVWSLAACGIPSGNQNQVGTTIRAKGGAAVFMAWGDPDRYRIRDGLVSRIMETTGVKAEWIHTTGGNEYYDKLQAMAASDTAPDLFLFAPSYFMEFVHANRLANLTPLIKRDKYDLSDFPEPSLTQYAWQGNQLGFPQDFPTRGLFYNVDLFQRAGVPLPPKDYAFNPSTWSWQTFLDAARRLTTGDPAAGGTFGWNTQFGLRPYAVWVYANGGELFNKELTESTITDPKTVEALQWLTDLMHRHRVAPTRQMTNQEKYNDMFTRGRVAMIESLPGSINTFRTVKGFTFDVAPIPVGINGKKAATGGGSGQGMASSSKNKDAAWEFLKFMLGPEAQLAHARDGATFPSRKSIQVHSEVAVPGQMPQNFKMFVDGQRHVRLDPQATNWREIESAMSKELNALWDGQRSAREAATVVKGLVDQMLKEAAARKPRA